MVLMILGQISIQQKVQEMVDGDLVFPGAPVRVLFVCLHLPLEMLREVVMSIDFGKIFFVLDFTGFSAVKIDIVAHGWN